MPKKVTKKITPSRKKAKGYGNSAVGKAKKIKLLIVDVDGVMTDGSIILDNEGNEFKRFNVRDTHGIKLPMRHGIEVAITTGRQSKVVNLRAKELGIKHVYQKCRNKVGPYQDLKSKLSVSDSEMAYIGDDVVDIPIMKRVGLSIAVSDAHKDILEFADIITEEEGGKCAVRSVCDFILKSKGIWKEIISGYIEA
jgi:3-deoxy-D-manno-octulosonate 8-phosphate phosphatase (KDO 8-P phosphatase)